MLHRPLSPPESFKIVENTHSQSHTHTHTCVCVCVCVCVYRMLYS